MLKAVIYGIIASGALFIGSVLALWLNRRYPPGDEPSGEDDKPPAPDRSQVVIDRITRAVTAFGAGVLLCSLAFELMEDAYVKGGFDQVTVGFLAGAAMFVVFDLFLDRLGSGVELMLGALLDGVPESAVIGIGLVAGKGVGFVMMVAVFISNFPEGFTGTRDMLAMKGDEENWITRHPLAMWSGVTLICAASTVVGYAALGSLSESWIAFILAFAAGSILAMVSHTMIPEAFAGVWEVRRKSGRRFRIGDKVEASFVVLGFLLAFILSHAAG